MSREMSQQYDACAGIALLYGEDDDYTSRLAEAMQADDLEEMEHVSAVIVAMLYGRMDAEAEFAAEQWNKAFC